MTRPTLTSRRRIVARMLLTGATNAQIATAIGRQESTVKTAVSSILAVLGVRNRTEAAAYLTAHPALLEDPPPKQRRVRRTRRANYTRIDAYGAGRIALEECWR